MYLCKTDETLASHGRDCQTIDECVRASNERAIGVDRGHHIGVLITDDCTLSDVVDVLAKTYNRFGVEWRSGNVSSVRIRILASRSGLISRDSGSIPVWCEAIGDVDLRDFDFFVLPQRATGGFAPPEIKSWLAGAADTTTVISLSLADETASGAGRAFEHSPKEAEKSRSVDTLEAGRRRPSLVAVNGEADVELRETSHSARLGAQLNARTPSRRIRAAMEWLNENYGEHVSIPGVAQRVLMSERNFQRRFVAEVGLTPHEYLSWIRLENARRLLAGSALPVDKIARHCGLCNGDHLRKHFLKYLGMTPVEYRSVCSHAMQSTG